MMEGNPWNVADVSEFLKYCCPECNHQAREFSSFKEHAIHNHQHSHRLFRIENLVTNSNISIIRNGEPIPEDLIKQELKDANEVIKKEMDLLEDMPDHNIDAEESAEFKAEESAEFNAEESAEFKAEESTEYNVEESAEFNDQDFYELDAEPMIELESEPVVELALELSQSPPEFRSDPDCSPGSNHVEPKETSSSQVIILKSLASNEKGWWTCPDCTNASFLFDFELLKHYSRVHGKLILLNGLAIKNKKELVRRNNLLTQSEWECLYCPYSNSHPTKTILLNHWEKSHKSDADVEFCQECEEIFIGKNFGVSDQQIAKGSE